MADADMRAAERAALEGGAQASARLLQKRVQAGQLERSKVKLAAYLGHEAAQLVEPCDLHGPGSALVSPPLSGRRAGDRRYAGACPRCVPHADMGCWAKGVSRYLDGREACGRAAVAAGLRALPAVQRSGYAGGCPCTFLGCRQCRAHEVVQAARAWTDCPCDRHEAGCLDQLARIDMGALSLPAWAFEMLAIVAGDAMALPEDRLPLALGGAVRLTSESAIRLAVRSALIPWALGEAP